MKESDIVRVCCDYLALKRHFFWRQNTAPTVQKSADGWAFRSMPKYAMRGIPDIIVIWNGQFVGLEVKQPTGRQSPDQKEFERRCLDAGAEYHLVRSVDDLIEIGL